eukprot:7323786-Pyramimonas_sp.AAC.1
MVTGGQSRQSRQQAVKAPQRRPRQRTSSSTRKSGRARTEKGLRNTWKRPCSASWLADLRDAIKRRVRAPAWSE